MDPRDSYRVHEVAASLGLPVPIIALCLGEKGKLSRVLNSRYDSQPITTTLLPYIRLLSAVSTHHEQSHRSAPSHPPPPGLDCRTHHAQTTTLTGPPSPSFPSLPLSLSPQLHAGHLDASALGRGARPAHVLHHHAAQAGARHHPGQVRVNG